MRKFSIYINGVKNDLNGENGIWFTNPSGLGLNFSPQFVNLRNGFYEPTATDDIPLGSIAGTLTFMPIAVGQSTLTAYDNYFQFVRLVTNFSDLEIGYTPTSALNPVEYRIKVRLDHLDKGELNGKWLTCLVGFIAITPWYTTAAVNVPLTLAQGDTNLYVAKYTPPGNVPSAFALNATGGGTPLSVFADFDNGNETTGIFTIPFSSVIASPGTLEFSTQYSDSHATFTRSGTTTDLINLVALNSDDTPIFPRLMPLVENRVAVLYAQGTTKPTSISMTVYNYYRSV